MEEISNLSSTLLILIKVNSSVLSYVQFNCSLRIRGCYTRRTRALGDWARLALVPDRYLWKLTALPPRIFGRGALLWPLRSIRQIIQSRDPRWSWEVEARHIPLWVADHLWKIVHCPSHPHIKAPSPLRRDRLEDVLARCIGGVPRFSMDSFAIMATTKICCLLSMVEG